MNYKFYPGLNQVVIDGVWKKSEIVRIANVTRGTDLYNIGETLTVRAIVENGIEKTVLKIGKRNPLIKGMESDDTLFISVDTSVRDNIAKKQKQKQIDKAAKANQKEIERQEKEDEAEAKKKHIGYHKADIIKRKSLSSLIGEKYWQDDQGLASSIGGAVSDKARGMGVRIKRAFDPLRMVRAMTPFGKRSAVTAMGRLFGRSDEDIQHFGGYKRSNKDTKRTKLGPGQVRDLQTGDSSADILAKIYNFMVKDHERQKKERELEESFRKEQMDESERRHVKLVESIAKFNAGGHLPDEKTDPAKEQKAMQETIMGGFKSILKPFLAFANMIKTVITGILTGIGSMSSAVFGGLEKLFTGVVLSAVSGLYFFVHDKFTSITKLLGGLFTMFNALRTVGIIRAALSALGPIAGLAAAAAALYEFGTPLAQMLNGDETNALKDERLKMTGKDAETDYETYHKNKKRWENELSRTADENGEMFRKDVPVSMLPNSFQVAYEKNAKLKERADQAAVAFQKEKYYSKIKGLVENGGLTEVAPTINSDGYAELTYKVPILERNLTLSELLKLSGAWESITGATKSTYNSIKGSAEEKLKKSDIAKDLLKGFDEGQSQFLKSMEEQKKNIPEKMDDETEGHDTTTPQVLSLNNNNTIGSAASYNDITPISPRIRNDSINLALARTSFAV